MHGFFYSVLIALANSVDSLGAWIAFSLKGIKVNNLMCLWIFLLTFLVSAASAFAGRLLPGVMDGGLCKWIGMSLFVAMGIWFIADPFIKRRKKRRDEGGIIGILENPEAADANRSKDIDFREATMLGIALSIDNAGGSLTAGIIGLDPLLIGLLSAVFGFGALLLTRFISPFLRKLNLGNVAPLVSGGVLILIGIVQVL
jgi:putative sporulation protein YtaF